MGNPITGEGIPNPAPNVVPNWGELPEGREWGSTAGIDIDPIDGHIWAYERCGAGTFGSGAPINCDNNPVDPVFKFDRNTGEVLANFGGGLMVTPHGIHVDSYGNVWVTDFAGNADGTKGHQVFKFSPSGEVLVRSRRGALSSIRSWAFSRRAPRLRLTARTDAPLPSRADPGLSGQPFLIYKTACT